MNNTNNYIITESGLSGESRQMSAQQSMMMLMPSLMGAAISGKLTPFIMPTLIKLIIIPLLDIINTISKAFVFIGLLAYFITLSLPLLLAHFGFIGRSHDTTIPTELAKAIGF